MVPVITPYELIVGLDPEFTWNFSEYEIDTRNLSPHIQRLEKNLNDSSDAFELVDTRYEKGVVKSAGEYLNQRSFKGLEINENETVSVLEEGRSGIARGYTHEK